ncbi:WhiB family transcriptional regulator [Mycobacterium sp. E3198]|uniref:WhiB family transcriptional regulator n=1 Tax=Mycobacterium sp. E3198 TaxID=1834143 RepID=UPI0008005651|nr:WhiB family transcriptional regulator [Mycobacterium sp. E3198]OBG39515.1 transcriptional regulator [Mycobacterium sp. E3198]
MPRSKPAGQRPHLAATRGAVSGTDAADPTGWVSSALCLTVDPETLFVRGAAQREAAIFCRRCPVMRECGAEALDNRVEFGIWGGMTERQRRALLQRHPEMESWSKFLSEQRNRGAG